MKIEYHVRMQIPQGKWMGLSVHDTQEKAAQALKGFQIGSSIYPYKIVKVTEEDVPASKGTEGER